MKKSLYLVSFLVLLIVVFLGRARFNQRGTGRYTTDTAERQVHHYVDPMNPAHTSQEPGIAPCGMPMEPVYVDPTDGPSIIRAAFSASPGAVKINQQKQQIIGVQIGTVTRAVETLTIRALGRILPDENRVYPLIAPAVGWMEEINEGTTGSLVKKNQLLAQIKVLDYAFYTQQLRYLTEHKQKDLGRPTLSGPEQAQIEPEMQTTTLPNAPPQETDAVESPPNTGSPSHTHPSLPEQSPADQTSLEAVKTSVRPEALQSSPPSENTPPDSPHKMGTEHPVRVGARNIRIGEQPNIAPGLSTLVPEQWWVDLMNFGVTEGQLKQFAESGAYISHVDLRSPVDGYVLSRKISPLQRIDRGQECYRIADLGRVWVETDIFDIETKYIQPGMQARVSTPKQDRFFTAEVSAVPPRFDAAARSLKVRLELDNPGNVLRPDMFVDVAFLVPLPEAITVPSDAVIDSGTKKTVYVAVEEGIFEPRPVVTGWQTSDRIEIVEGLHPGEKIVVSGNFLIDSESRMKLAATKMVENKTGTPLKEQAPLPAAAPEPQTAIPVITGEATAGPVKDPVCGMAVDQDKASAAGLIVETEGKIYYFCSTDCLEKFKQEPQRYRTGKVGQQEQTALDHRGHHHD